MRLDIPSVIDLVTQSLPLSNWGFAESAKTDSYVIYDSQWCRIKFLIEKDRTQDYLHVYYGRLHALDNSWAMSWHGVNCSCWHNRVDLQLALEFLDHTSPEIAYKRHLEPLPLFREYDNSEFAKSIVDSQERFLKLHSFIWERYGERFFELFDLRRPSLWEQYLAFLKEFYNFHYEEMDMAYKRMGQVRAPDDPLLYNKC